MKRTDTTVLIGSRFYTSVVEILQIFLNWREILAGNRKSHVTPILLYEAMIIYWSYPPDCHPWIAEPASIHYSQRSGSQKEDPRYIPYGHSGHGKENTRTALSSDRFRMDMSSHMRPLTSAHHFWRSNCGSYGSVQVPGGTKKSLLSKDNYVAQTFMR